MFKLPEDLESKYAFVTKAAARAEQLQLGAVPRVDDPARKFTVIAQEEVAAGLIAEVDPNAVPEEEEAVEEE